MKTSNTPSHLLCCGVSIHRLLLLQFNPNPRMSYLNISYNRLTIFGVFIIIHSRHHQHNNSNSNHSNHHRKGVEIADGHPSESSSPSQVQQKTTTTATDLSTVSTTFSNTINTIAALSDTSTIPSHCSTPHTGANSSTNDDESSNTSTSQLSISLEAPRGSPFVVDGINISGRFYELHPVIFVICHHPHISSTRYIHHDPTIVPCHSLILPYTGYVVLGLWSTINIKD
ncbi:hypothetical protein BCR42DRAFT_444392 [Absidia repens]|uniref:Uncharacterized protein n=1 Tax=Absidia repens TaxID=90262 RepID=A0A1X2HRB4_9FUNG|nr:hypothetical protein BCR42DRAFT_444392 [Absidia repens]